MLHAINKCHNFYSLIAKTLKLQDLPMISSNIP